MATLVKVLRQDTDAPHKKVTVELNGPASYPNTGATIGDRILAQEFGLQSIEQVMVMGAAVNSSGVAARKVDVALPLATTAATQLGGPLGHTSIRLIWSDLDGTQAANASDQSAYRVRLVIWGNGS